MRWIKLSASCGVLLVLLCAHASAGIIDSKHNLSVSGPGVVKVSGESQICIFCHVRYNPDPQVPDWNRYASGTTYIPYSSSTLNAFPGQPSGSSLLCLGCHDGTTAMGELVGKGRELSLQLAMRDLGSRSSNMGTDLSDDHPISLYYHDSYSGDPSEFVNPASLTDEVRLDDSGQIQCTSCHDPHDDTLGKFLLKPVEGGELCLTCHIKQGWTDSAHVLVTQAVRVDKKGGAVGGHDQTACGLCHTSHSAGGRERLVYFENEENNCLTCHSSDLADSNMEAEFSKLYRHPISEKTGVHDPSEPAVISTRHAECVDCHNPHATRESIDAGAAESGIVDSTSASGVLPGPLTAVRGVTISGAAIDARSGITREYQLCFRCHGDSNNLPAPSITRQVNETNVRVEFNPTRESYHPVVEKGANLEMPSLIDPLTVNSQISCIDCHNNNDVAGPAGPHGSNFPALLEREYRTQFPTRESPSAYAICYKCHDRNSILGDESFSSHDRHITGRDSLTDDLYTPCSVCHDPHGSQNQKLMNFDIGVVAASSSGRLEYFTSGTQTGGCYLSCHGVDHDPLCYAPATSGADPSIPGC